MDTSNTTLCKAGLHNYEENKMPTTTGYRCRPCQRIQVNKYRDRMRREYPEEWQMMRQRHQISYYHGLSATEYDNILIDQEFACAICGIHAQEIATYPHKLVVDHNHRTDRVRALLCSQCNAALGLIKENPMIAASMAAYIEHHSKIDDQLPTKD